MKKHSAVFFGENLKDGSLHKWFPLAAILLLAIALRLYQIGHESLWVDEFHSIRSTEGLEFHFRVVYFALLRVWMLLGTSEAWLRGLSVVFGIGCVFLTYELGYRLVGRATGLISAFVVAVSPLFIFHSQEVRMYMVSTFLTMAGTLALVRVFEHPTLALLGLWLLTRLLAIYTTPLNLLLLLPDVLLVFFNFRKQRRLFIAILGGIPVLGLLFLPVAFRFVNASKFFFSKAGTLPSFSEVLGQLPAATVYWPMRQLPKDQVWLYGVWGLILLGLLGFLFFNKRRSARLAWLAAWAFLPTGIMLIVSLVVGDIWTPRYLLLSTPYVIILLAAGFVEVWRWKRTVAWAVAAVYALVLGIGLFHYYGKTNVTDWRGVVQTINAQEQPGDQIVVSSEFMRDEVFDHYYSGSAPIQFVDSLRSGRQVDQSQLAEDLQRFSSDSSRLWLVYARSRQAGSKGGQHRQTLQAVIENQYNVQQHEVFSGYLDTLDLFLLTP